MLNLFKKGQEVDNTKEYLTDISVVFRNWERSWKEYKGRNNLQKPISINELIDELSKQYKITQK